MKQNLQRISEWIELFLNYAVVFGIEIALNALIGDRVPVGVWLAAALYPVCFYLFRKKLKHFWVFFLLHPAVVVFATLMVKSWPVGAVAIAVLGVFYGLHSIRLRVHQVIQEREFPLPAAAVVVIAAFLVCSYKQSQTDCMLVLGSFFVWLPGILIKRYADNYLSYVKINAGSAGVIPEKNIFRTGIIVVALYSVVCVALLIVCCTTPLVDKLTEGAIWLGKILRWLIVWLLTMLSGEPEKAVEQATVSVPEMEMGWGEFEEVRPTPVWIEVLGKLVFWSIVVALIVAVLVSIVLLFRWMIKSFYQTGRGRKETLEAGVEEKTESIAYREKRKRAQLFIGIEPSAKIRRAYKKTIEGAFGRRQKKKEQERKEAVWLGVANSLTAQELTRQAWGDTGHEDWEQLTELYEQARYGGTELEREQARAAVKLSGKILHMIKKK